MKIVIRHKKYLQETVKKLLKIAGPRRLFAFYGPMGSGKTTIIKAICRELGAVDKGSSPSFTIVNEYLTVDGKSLYHIDFYRMNKPKEVYDSGIEEYLSSGSYCFMEWPELIEDILPPETCRIRISVGDNNERKLEVM